MRGDLSSPRIRPERCGTCDGELRHDEDVLDTWFSSALWPFATLGWPEETPELRAWYPTDVLSTARDIIFLWVARMVMMGLEFTGEVPFTDVNIHSVIQAPDGRRMSKSLGTGIDPLDAIDVHGADALRFGLLAMSSSQDVRYSDAKVPQGRDLANKLWNASRLILLNARGHARRPAPRRGKRGRGSLDPLAAPARRSPRSTAGSTPTTSPTPSLELYRFFWSEFCDWYLEIVKPRLYDGEAEVAANLLQVLERFLALAHPFIPFVTEEIWGYLPGRSDAPLIVAAIPVADDSRVDAEAEAEIEAAIELTRGIRRWRDLAGVPVASVLPARVAGRGAARAGRPARAPRARRRRRRRARQRRAARAARLRRDRSRHQVRERIEARAAELRAEVERGERKLANQGFVAKAPRRGRRGRAREARGLPRGARRSLKAEDWLARSTRSAGASGSSGSRRCWPRSAIPQLEFESIHVVGTNGKSSVTQMTAALLEAPGPLGRLLISRRTPSAGRERVRVRGAEIDADAF